MKWEIDVYADTPKEAALFAEAQMRTSNVNMLTFNVTDPEGVEHEIDLFEVTVLVVNEDGKVVASFVSKPGFEETEGTDVAKALGLDTFELRYAR